MVRVLAVVMRDAHYASEFVENSVVVHAQMRLYESGLFGTELMSQSETGSLFLRN